MIDKARQEGAPLETFRTSFDFFYGQEPGFGDFDVGAGFRSHQQGLFLVPQQHTSQAYLGWAKTQLHDYLLPNPRFKRVPHAASQFFVFVSGQHG